MSSMVVTVLVWCVVSAAFAWEYYEDGPKPKLDLLVLFVAYLLTQLAASLSRLVYDSQRGLARLLQVVAVLGTVSFLVLLIAIIIY